MNNIFEEIRNRVSMQDAAKFYGLQISHSGMACCPFHDDKTPSLKIYEDNYYCFGCGSTGDCTGFTAKLFNITQFEAAKKISYDFGLRLFEQGPAIPVNERLKTENDFNVWIRKAKISVSDYLDKLLKWRIKYAPLKSTDEFHPLFVESLKRTSYVEYIAETLTYGTDKEKRELFERNKEDILKIQKRLEKISDNKRNVKRKII